jgi:hypothetical protein
MSLETFYDSLSQSRGPTILRQILDELREHPEETEESIARRDLERLFPVAVRALGNLAVYSSDDKVRVGAAKFLVSTNLRLVELQFDAINNPVEAFAKQVMDETKRIERGDE